MKKIIVAPLNWGLGHASRCVPIIKELQKNNFIPIIASDGNALTFLKKEFPTLEYFELPSYDISYGKNLKWSLLLKTTTIIRAVKKEQEIIQSYNAYGWGLQENFYIAAGEALNLKNINLFKKLRYQYEY